MRSATLKLLEESNDILKEMKDVVNITTLSMTDKERMDVVDRCYNRVRRYRNLVMYYTNKNISVSLPALAQEERHGQGAGSLRQPQRTLLVTLKRIGL